jgi:hypothetical protein
VAKTQTVRLGKKGSFKIRKGALHRALDKSEGRKLSASDLVKASNSSNPRVRRMAASAKGLKAMHHGRKSRKGRK